MLAKQLHEFRSLLSNNGIMFAYSGYISEGVLSGVGEALKRKLTDQETDTKTLRNVFAIFVEQMQNIIRYSAESETPPDEDGGLRYGVLTVGFIEGAYFVQAGNLIQKEDVAALHARLAAIRDMDKDALKAAYKERLKSAPEATSKGAGVGLIEIARRATQPIEFDICDVDAGHAFFSLTASIGTGDA